ncbi:hypothetical protein ACFCQI_02960 [Rhodanobacter sp. FW102-FHT14D06]|uniref:Uncharacterized protein n=2 Tax=unclassified Rhodanobacter TaxID=2621553 RepID=A0AB74UW68_9GAMM
MSNLPAFISPSTIRIKRLHKKALTALFQRYVSVDVVRDGHNLDDVIALVDSLPLIGNGMIRLRSSHESILLTNVAASQFTAVDPFRCETIRVMTERVG